jgi:7,8-dihydropterin-6-yl-methyl-4-(beta-D-ribofuranosyl)aminobenzene 5'-phosphate synthase
MVDVAVVSHGHYDHGGGLNEFMKLNKKAKIFIRESAFAEYFSERAKGEFAYIGLDKTLINSERFVFTDEYLAIDDELELFSGIEENELFFKFNSMLKVMKNGELIKDSFVHEQNLIVKYGGKEILFCGCAHNGIVNIINHFHKTKLKYPDFVFGGFHLSSPRTKETEDEDVIKQLSFKLDVFGSVFYTCHCTGIGPFNQLKDSLKEKINYAAAGSCIEII